MKLRPVPFPLRSRPALSAAVAALAPFAILAFAHIPFYRLLAGGDEAIRRGFPVLVWTSRAIQVAAIPLAVAGFAGLLRGAFAIRRRTALAWAVAGWLLFALAPLAVALPVARRRRDRRAAAYVWLALAAEAAVAALLVGAGLARWPVYWPVWALAFGGMAAYLAALRRLGAGERGHRALAWALGAVAALSLATQPALFAPRAARRADAAFDRVAALARERGETARGGVPVAPDGWRAALRPPAAESDDPFAPFSRAELGRARDARREEVGLPTDRIHSFSPAERARFEGWCAQFSNVLAAADAAAALPDYRSCLDPFSEEVSENRDVPPVAFEPRQWVLFDAALAQALRARFALDDGDAAAAAADLDRLAAAERVFARDPTAVGALLERSVRRERWRLLVRGLALWPEERLAAAEREADAFLRDQPAALRATALGEALWIDGKSRPVQGGATEVLAAFLRASDEFSPGEDKFDNDLPLAFFGSGGWIDYFWAVERRNLMRAAEWALESADRLADGDPPRFVAADIDARVKRLTPIAYLWWGAWAGSLLPDLWTGVRDDAVALRAALAAERFRRDRGILPASPDELVAAGFLDEVPRTVSGDPIGFESGDLLLPRETRPRRDDDPDEPEDEYEEESAEDEDEDESTFTLSPLDDDEIALPDETVHGFLLTVPDAKGRPDRDRLFLAPSPVPGEPPAGPGPVIVFSTFRPSEHFRNLYRARDPAARERALARWGAFPAERSVLRALRFLATVQREDGSWPGRPVSATALALWAYLDHGDVAAPDTEFGPAVERAVRFLAVDVDPETGLFRSASGDPLAQPLGAFALAVYVKETANPVVRFAAKAASRPLFAGQRPDGAWNADPLDPSPDGPGDLRATVRCALALRGALLWSDAENAPYDAGDALRRAGDAIARFLDPATGAALRPDGAADPATAAAAFALNELGRRDDPLAKKAVAFLAPCICDFERWESAGPWGRGDSPLRDWLFVTFAKYGTNPDFPAWNSWFLPEFLKRQTIVPAASSGYADREGTPRDIGWWDSPSAAERGAGDTADPALPRRRWRDGESIDGETAPGDRVRDTCLAALTMMVYYSFPPAATHFEDEAARLRSSETSPPALVRRKTSPVPAEDAPAP